jgi:hypothetical protein
MSKQLEQLEQYQIAQIVGLVRKLSSKRGMRHTNRGTVEVPLHLLNQLSTLANLYDGKTEDVPQCSAQGCPLLQEQGGRDG